MLLYAATSRRSLLMISVLSRFVVANDLTDKVKEAFLNRPHSVDQCPGFVRLEVLSPRDAPNEIWLLTYWEDEWSYREWHSSHSYRESHAGIPKGLKLVPSATQLRFFDLVAC
jgi:heme-degrading monooxygenase HmoA